MLLLVLTEERLKVLVDCMQEGVDFFQGGLGELLDLSDSLVDHIGEFFSFVLILFVTKVHFVEQDFHCFDDLLTGELEIFVRGWHLEVRINELLQFIGVIATDDGWEFPGIGGVADRTTGFISSQVSMGALTSMVGT